MTNNITKPTNLVDIQDIPPDDRRRLFEIFKILDIIKGNDTCYIQNFSGYVWIENGEMQFDHTMGEWIEMYQILNRYVPDEILRNNFILKIWW